jgi:hypothetical protein
VTQRRKAGRWPRQYRRFAARPRRLKEMRAQIERTYSKYGPPTPTPVGTSWNRVTKRSLARVHTQRFFDHHRGETEARKLKSLSNGLNRVSSSVKLMTHLKRTLCSASSSLCFVSFSCLAGRFRLGRIVSDTATRRWRNIIIMAVLRIQFSNPTRDMIIPRTGFIVLNSGSIRRL